MLMASRHKAGQGQALALLLCCSSVVVDESQDLSSSLIPLLSPPTPFPAALKGLEWPSLDPIDFNGKICDPCCVVWVIAVWPALGRSLPRGKRGCPFGAG